jgi:hypothetical protein
MDISGQHGHEHSKAIGQNAERATVALFKFTPQWAKILFDIIHGAQVFDVYMVHVLLDVRVSRNWKIMC